MDKKDCGGNDRGFYEPYSNITAKLRGWFVTYGIGAPVLFVSQLTISTALEKSGCGRFVITLFLIGVALQVLIALIHKTTMWYAYLGEVKENFKKQDVTKYPINYQRFIGRNLSLIVFQWGFLSWQRISLCPWRYNNNSYTATSSS